MDKVQNSEELRTQPYQDQKNDCWLKEIGTQKQERGNWSCNRHIWSCRLKSKRRETNPVLSSRELNCHQHIQQHHKHRLYTWMSPGDPHRNQIDFISVKSCLKNQVKDVHTYPRADTMSDHNRLVTKLNLKLKLPENSQRIFSTRQY